MYTLNNGNNSGDCQIPLLSSTSFSFCKFSVADDKKALPRLWYSLELVKWTDGQIAFLGSRSAAYGIAHPGVRALCIQPACPATPQACGAKRSGAGSAAVRVHAVLSALMLHMDHPF